MKKTFFFCFGLLFISTIGFAQSVTETPDPSDSVDRIFSRVEVEASFPGGDAAWIKYLQKNLKSNVPVKRKAPAGTYNVVVRFIVSKNGTITAIQPETNLGYGMEEEVMRVIKKGPDWLPAQQNGRKVNAYRRQPITFVVTEK